jgi:hypothetical protein
MTVKEMKAEHKLLRLILWRISGIVKNMLLLRAIGFIYSSFDLAELAGRKPSHKSRTRSNARPSDVRARRTRCSRKKTGRRRSA